MCTSRDIPTQPPIPPPSLSPFLSLPLAPSPPLSLSVMVSPPLSASSGSNCLCSCSSTDTQVHVKYRAPVQWGCQRVRSVRHSIVRYKYCCGQLSYALNICITELRVRTWLPATYVCAAFLGRRVAMSCTCRQRHSPSIGDVQQFDSMIW